MSWQELTFYLVITLVFLVVLSLVGYVSQKTLSFGGLVLSWNLYDNILASIILPPLIILITAVCLVSIDKTWLIGNLWLISLFIFVLRSLLMFLANRMYAVRINDWVISGGLSIFLAFLVNRLVIYSEYSIKLSPSNISAILWSSFVFSVFYLLMKVVPKHYTDLNTNRDFLAKLYRSYYKKYSGSLNKEFIKDKVLQRIFFAILITEDLNRPRIFRMAESLVFPLGFIKTTGIMQVTSNDKLTDIKSVVMAQDFLKQYYEESTNHFKSDYMRIKEMAYLYNDGDFYVDLIVYCYFTLTEIDAFNGEVDI